MGSAPPEESVAPSPSDVVTAGHLLFSIAMTGYILIATQLEEHDLIDALGDEYRDYRGRVPMVLPWPRPHTTEVAPQG